jgi:putative oxygen-independent coproporphyrinogen III oxidase
MQPFGVYIHWPYCVAKCPYCDFNSQVTRPVSEERWLACILRELRHYAELVPNRTVSSIFLGGGTPSLMQPQTAARVIEVVTGLWSVAPDAEITFEANPSSVEAASFAAFRAGGFNRVSLGVQSLRDDDLRFLGRVHCADEARTAIAVAHANFSRVSFDLIYARPNQTLDAWRAELGEALDLAAGHLSLYQLTIELGTAFHRLARMGKLHVPDGEVGADLYALTGEICEAAGMTAYEVSNYARPGEESRHNQLYWRYGEYAGVGPGAHGRIVADDIRLALAAERNPAKWAALVEQGGVGLVEREELTRFQEAEEMLLMGMRLAEGVPLDALARVTGHAVAVDTLRDLTIHGLLDGSRAGIVAATPEGRMVLNAVIEKLAEALRPVPDYETL